MTSVVSELEDLISDLEAFPGDFPPPTAEESTTSTPSVNPTPPPTPRDTSAKTFSYVSTFKAPSGRVGIKLSGKYVLAVFEKKLEKYDLSNDGGKILWSRELPQGVGPTCKKFMIQSSGTIVLWYKSTYLLDEEGRLKRKYEVKGWAEGVVSTGVVYEEGDEGNKELVVRASLEKDATLHCGGSNYSVCERPGADRVAITHQEPNTLIIMSQHGEELIKRALSYPPAVNRAIQSLSKQLFAVREDFPQTSIHLHDWKSGRELQSVPLAELGLNGNNMRVEEVGSGDGNVVHVHVFDRVTKEHSVRIYDMA